MSITLASIGSLFDRAIVDTGRLPSFLFFVALLGTFGFIRTSTHMIRAQVSWWPGNVNVGGTHVHHLVWGIFAMMIFGYIGVVVAPGSPWHEIVAVFFGIGMGLTLDEFALWLELKDVYWEKDGRKSVDAMVIAGGVAGIILVGFSAWVEVADSVESAVFAVVGALGAAAIVVALVNASKQKFGMALLGLLIWPAALIPALRLAKPNSLWARVFYRDHKRARAQARYPAEAGAGPGSDAAAPGAAADGPEPGRVGSGTSSGSATSS